jgi:hypothetical protein
MELDDIQLPILKYIKLAITLILLSSQRAGVERLPPSKRALVEQRCSDRATRAVKRRGFSSGKAGMGCNLFCGNTSDAQSLQ